MAGVKGKAGRKRKGYVRLVGYVPKEHAAFVASFAPSPSDALCIVLDLASKSIPPGIHAQSADVSKQAA